MSIASEIARINNNIAAAYTAADEKGAAMPQTQNSANLANTIGSIPQERGDPQLNNKVKKLNETVFGYDPESVSLTIGNNGANIFYNGVTTKQYVFRVASAANADKITNITYTLIKTSGGQFGPGGNHSVGEAFVFTPAFDFNKVYIYIIYSEAVEDKSFVFEYGEYIAEGISERIVDVEGEVSDLDDDVAAAEQALTDLKTDIDGYEQNVKEMTAGTYVDYNGTSGHTYRLIVSEPANADKITSYNYTIVKTDNSQVAPQPSRTPIPPLGKPLIFTPDYDFKRIYVWINYSETVSDKSFTFLYGKHLKTGYLEDIYKRLNYVTVDANGNGDYLKISDALAATRGALVIHVMPGTYVDSVLCGSRDIYIIGTDKHNCILVNTSGAYATPPLFIASGCVKNMTIKAAYDANVDYSGVTHFGYAVHVDSYGTDKKLTFDNCEVISEFSNTFGCGATSGQTFEIKDCHIVHKSCQVMPSASDCFSMHGSTANDPFTMIFKNNVFDADGNDISFGYGSVTTPITTVYANGNFARTVVNNSPSVVSMADTNWGNSSSVLNYSAS